MEMAASDFSRLREKFSGRGVLLSGRISSPVERLCYYSAYNFLKSSKKESLVWVSTDYPYDKVLELFSEYGYNIKPYLDRFLFVDLISLKSGASNSCKSKSVRCVQDPGNLTELSLAIGEHMESAKCGMLVVHLVNSLLVYNELSRALEFMRIMDALAYDKKFAFLGAYIEGEQDDRARVAIQVAIDVIAKLEGMHVHIVTPTDVHSFDMVFGKGTVDFKKAEGKVTREQFTL
jgi:hypothetical protein